jgi:spoIIIJ-associated protein
VPKEDEMSIEAQAELAELFVRGVVEGFGFDATVESSVSDDVIQVRVAGDGLGLLVGPRGATVDALQELTRTAVQHRSDEHAGRIHVDVAGYRARRTAALQEFARRVAEEVIANGQAQALEPMNAVDRKAVHDAIGDLAGVSTGSEGEDPRRYVVIRPATAGTQSTASDDEDAGDLLPDDDSDEFVASDPESGAS